MDVGTRLTWSMGGLVTFTLLATSPPQLMDVWARLARLSALSVSEIPELARRTPSHPPTVIGIPG